MHTSDCSLECLRSWFFKGKLNQTLQHIKVFSEFSSIILRKLQKFGRKCYTKFFSKEIKHNTKFSNIAIEIRIVIVWPILYTVKLNFKKKKTWNKIFDQICIFIALKHYDTTIILNYLWLQSTCLPMFT